MLTFQPATPKPISVDSIILNGVVIGEMKVHSDHGPAHRYHASIHLNAIQPTPGLASWDLIQGFGPTPEAAIENAITTGLAAGRALIAGATALSEQLSVAQHA